MSNIWLGSNGKVIKYGSGVRVCTSGLPAIASWTFRFKFLIANAIDPTVDQIGMSGIVWTAVDRANGIYDATVPRRNDANRFAYGSMTTPLTEAAIGTKVDIIGANTLKDGLMFQSDSVFWNATALRNCDFTWETPSAAEGGSLQNYGHAYCFRGCTNLVIPPRYERAFSTLTYTYEGCTNLKYIPMIPLNDFFVTASAQQILADIRYTFRNCVNVESGALEYYTYAKNCWDTWTSPPSASRHSNTFTNCGSNTTTGAAELAQIPSSWGGTGA
jgi:hypothetical protein